MTDKSPNRKNDDPMNKFDIDFTPLRGFMQQMDSFFNQSFKQMNSHFNLSPFWVQTYETDNDMIVEAELPGYRRDQIHLEIIGNRLRISAEDPGAVKEKNNQDRRQMYQKRERIVTLPFVIPEKETKASFHNGLLKITIPKMNSKRKWLDIDG